MLCEQCHKYQNDMPLKDCDFCVRVGFTEDVLCSICRADCEDEGLFECGAYRPKLSLVLSGQDDIMPIEPISIQDSDTETPGFSEARKWLNAYAKQQVLLNPDIIQFKLQYHVCLVANKRNAIFSKADKYIEKFSNIFNQIALSLNETEIEVLWLNSDHIHLYVNTTPDYSVDEIVNKLIKISGQKINSIYPELSKGYSGVWESAYFAESIG